VAPSAAHIAPTIRHAAALNCSLPAIGVAVSTAIRSDRFLFIRVPRPRGAAASLVLAVAALAGAPAPPAGAANFHNPIVEPAPSTGSADPSVVRHRGWYYYCRSIDDTAIAVARAHRLQDIGAAERTVVFRAPRSGPYSRQLWAPELQRIGARWYIYFAASDGDNAHHRMHVLRSGGDDPRGPYEFMGALRTTPDEWAIDGVALQWRGRLFFVWSGWAQANDAFPQRLYIARMKTPWRLDGKRHLLASPDQSWERAGAALLEAPEVLRGRGRTFIVYSAGASWSDDYGLGLLLHTGGDPRSAASWRKLPGPAFTKSPAAGVFGVGHASFVRSPDGREDWIVYHATSHEGAGWSGRSVRAQRFAWTRDGTPMFGAPVAPGISLSEPSGTPGLPALGRRSQGPHGKQPRLSSGLFVRDPGLRYRSRW